MPGQRAARKPRLLLLNQYFRPGVEATAQLLAELAEALAEEMEVVVVTGHVRGRSDLSAREQHGGLETRRVRATTFDRVRIPARAANYVTYLLSALADGLRLRRVDVVLCGTDPPVIGDVALLVARRHSAPLVVITEDVFPEIALALGRLNEGVLARLLRSLVRMYLTRADRVVVLGETMRARVAGKGVDDSRLRVIPNWADVDAIRPTEKANEWSRAHELDASFVVMHAGNVGHAQDLDSLVHADVLLAEVEDLETVIIGTGARRAELERLALRLQAPHVRFSSSAARRLVAGARDGGRARRRSCTRSCRLHRAKSSLRCPRGGPGGHCRDRGGERGGADRPFAGVRHRRARPGIRRLSPLRSPRAVKVSTTSQRWDGVPDGMQRAPGTVPSPSSVIAPSSAKS